MRDGISTRTHFDRPLQVSFFFGIMIANCSNSWRRKLVTGKAMLVARMTDVRATFKRLPVGWLAFAYYLRGAVLPLQGDVAAVRLGLAMRPLVFLLAGLFASAGLIHGEIKTPENGPIEITS